MISGRFSTDKWVYLRTIMDFILAAITTLFLIAYLGYAIFNPDKF